MESSDCSQADVKLLSPVRAVNRRSKGCTATRIKIWTTRITMAVFFFTAGVEYSVIFPTLWDFLRGKGGVEWQYGLALAGFSISNLLTGPLYGIAFDMTHRTKIIVLVANVFEIGGNFMYFAATSKYMIIGSRFLVGLGAGAGATLYGELARVSTVRERTKLFSMFSTFRQLGLIIGPAFNLGLHHLNAKMGPFVLDRLTSPGALMTVLWILVEVMFLVMFYKLPSAVEPVVVDQEEEENGDHRENTIQAAATVTQQVLFDDNKDGEEDGKSVVGGGGRTVASAPKPREETKTNKKKKNKKPILAKAAKWHISKANQENVAEEERTPLLKDPNGHTTNYSVNTVEPSEADIEVGGGIQRKEEEEEQEVVTRRGGGGGRGTRSWSYVKYVASQMMKEEIIVLLAVIFLTIFSQTVIETILVPIAENMLDWSETDISIFYSCAGVELIVSIFTVYIMSVWVGDRWIMLIGLVQLVAGFTLLLGFIGSGSKDIDGALWKIMLGCVLVVFGLPINLVAGASLYSKLLPMQVQGIGQGFRRSVFSAAAIIGPLWGGSALAFTSYYILIGVPVGLLVLVTIMVVLSLGKLKERKRPRGKNLLLP